MNIPKIPKLGALANASEGAKKKYKGVFIGILVILLGALGLETSNNDWDLGKIISGEGVAASRVLRDKEGNVVPEGAAGAKYTDEYNCDDFKTQPEAQKFFDKAGGVSKDTNRLDGDKNGIACQSLPVGQK